MSTLSFCVADVGFTLKFTDIPDARYLLPSYAPFFVKSLSNDEQIMNMIVGNDCETYSSENELWAISIVEIVFIPSPRTLMVSTKY